MNLPTQQSYRLVPCGGAGLACDEEGLALGSVDLARVRTDARGVRRIAFPNRVLSITPKRGLKQ